MSLAPLLLAAASGTAHRRSPPPAPCCTAGPDRPRGLALASHEAVVVSFEGPLALGDLRRCPRPEVRLPSNQRPPDVPQTPARWHCRCSPTQRRAVDCERDRSTPLAALDQVVASQSTW